MRRLRWVLVVKGLDPVSVTTSVFRSVERVTDFGAGFRRIIKERAQDQSLCHLSLNKSPFDVNQAHSMREDGDVADPRAESQLGAQKWK